MPETNTRPVYQPAEFPSDQPLRDHPFYKWLVNYNKENQGPDRIRNRDSTLYEMWAKDHDGSDLGEFALSRGASQTLRYCAEIAASCWRFDAYSYKFDDLFELVERDRPSCSSHSYWVMEAGHRLMSLGFLPKKLMMDIIDTVPLVHRFSPSEFFFSINGEGDLTLKYSKILGSNSVCNISDYTKDGECFKRYLTGQ